MARKIVELAAGLMLLAAALHGEGTVVAQSYPLVIAPGQVTVLRVAGFEASLRDYLSSPIRAGPGPLPFTLAGISVDLNQPVVGPSRPVPLIEVRHVLTCPIFPTENPSCGIVVAITVQIPFEFLADSRQNNALNLPGQLVIKQNNKTRAYVDVYPTYTRHSFVEACAFLSFNPSTRTCASYAVTHGDGSLITSRNPAKEGEVVTAYLYGMGYTTPRAETGVETPSPPPVVYSERLDALPLKYAYRQNRYAASVIEEDGGARLKVFFAGLSPGSVGLYQINFEIPAVPKGLVACQEGAPFATNMTISLSDFWSASAAGLCVAPPAGN